MTGLSSSCPDCGGSGRWFDMPEEQRRIGYGEMVPMECVTCDGWGVVPTAEGKPFFDLVFAMRRRPRWR